MTTRILTLASTNPGKADLIGALVRDIGGPRWRLETADPGDAEDKAAVGYRTASYAKAVALDPRRHPAIGHDSGFEFACLDGKPGPLTARWLNAQSADETLRSLQPGSDVRVVHCLTLVDAERITTVERTDVRRVCGILPTSLHGPLPLTSLLVGPKQALRSCLAEVLAAIEPLRPIR